MPSDKGSKLCLSKDVFHSHFKEHFIWTESPGWQGASFSVLKRLFHCLLASMLSLGSQSVFLSLFSVKPPSVLVGSSVVSTLQSFLLGKAHVSLFLLPRRASAPQEKWPRLAPSPSAPFPASWFLWFMSGQCCPWRVPCSAMDSPLPMQKLGWV